MQFDYAGNRWKKKRQNILKRDGYKCRNCRRYGREERLLSNIVQREEYKLMRDRAKISVSMVDRGLSVLTADEKRLLYRMYISQEKGKIAQLMSETGLMEPSSLYKRVNKALRRFTIALYGCTES